MVKVYFDATDIAGAEFLLGHSVSYKLIGVVASVHAENVQFYSPDGASVPHTSLSQ